MSVDNEYQDLPLIKIVGISASGKSTLVRALRNHGYRARPVSQEHSNVPSLWQEFDKPAILIHLDISLEAQQQRRPDVSWDKRTLREETTRLAMAQGNSDLKIDTSGLNAERVLAIALTFLEKEKIRHADHALPPLNATGSALTPSATPEMTTEMITGMAEESKKQSLSKKRKRRKRIAKEGK